MSGAQPRNQRAGPRSPLRSDATDSAVAVGNLLHHKTMAQSYNQHKMAEQLLADEEQMAAEQERIINQSSLLIQ